MNAEPVDPLPALVAELDQMLKTIPMWAQVTKARYDGLIEIGFTPQQALYITAFQWVQPQAPGE